jgi:hypothetical protein
VLSSARRAVFNGDGAFAGWVTRAGWTPPALTDEQCAVVADAAVAFRDMLEPGDPVAIVGRVRTLLAHWRDRDGLDEPTREQIYRDWMTVLQRYPAWAVHEAAMEWLEADRYRPTIADIRLLCDKATAAERHTLRLLERLAG